MELCQQRAWQPCTAQGGTANGPVMEAFCCPCVPARRLLCAGLLVEAVGCSAAG